MEKCHGWLRLKIENFYSCYGLTCMSTYECNRIYTKQKLDTSAFVADSISDYYGNYFALLVLIFVLLHFLKNNGNYSNNI